MRALGSLCASAALHAVLPFTFSHEAPSALQRTPVPLELETIDVPRSDAAAGSPHPHELAPAAAPRLSVSAGRARSAPERARAEPSESATPPDAIGASTSEPGPSPEPELESGGALAAGREESVARPGASALVHMAVGQQLAAATGTSPVAARESAEPDERRLRALRAAYLNKLRERVAAHRRYPYQARRAGIQGTVCLKLRVDAGGRLTALGSTCGAPPRALLGAALDAVRAAAPFEPLPSGLGTELAAELPVVFQLDSRTSQ